MDKDNIERLEKLAKLRDDGVITEDEFQEQKRKILNTELIKTKKDTKFGLNDNSYYALLHISQLCGYIIPGLGIAAPIILWYTNKDNDPLVDEHGKNVMNWMISLLIYYTISVLLMILLIGFLLIWALVVISIVFAIIGATKAYNNETWKYPLAINVIK